MRVRILCGAYSPMSPFIEGGCMFEWIELLGEAREISCPNCGRACPEEMVECMLATLRDHVVFAVGCVHRAFSFSRRTRGPYFHPVEVAGEAQEPLL